MSSAVIDIDKLLDIDPYNGKPVIRGSRLRVSRIAGLHRSGYSPEQIAEAFPKLTLAGVFAALSYYYTHRSEMDGEASRETAETLAAARAMGAEIV